jgi:UDP-glucose 4-epimerase
MKVLLIGGCGFIGSHVADSLLARGIQVRAFDRRPEPYRAPLEDVEYVLGDLTDSSQIYEALIGVDAVIHLASTTVPSTANLDPVGDITGNLIATVRLLEIMRATGQKKIVFLSSGGTVYGIPQVDPVVKVAIENYLHMEHSLHGLRHVILRASNPYGPRQGHTGIQGIIGTHLWRIARGEPVEVWGDGSVVRDFIHVRDLADLCVTSVLSDACGCYNAGSGQGTSVAEVVRSIDRTVQATGHAPVEPRYKPGRGFDVPRVVLDISRARADLGWSPRTGLDAGIAESWDWVRSRV